MLSFFTKEQIDIIEDAIVDNRASLEYEARSVLENKEKFAQAEL